MTALYIGLAGAIGSVSRYWIGLLVGNSVGAKTALPVATLAVNILGSLAMGLLIAIFTARGEMDSRLRLALTVGFLGGFTTYSSFALETVGLLEERTASMAALYVTVTLLGAAFACYLGFLLGRKL